MFLSECVITSSGEIFRTAFNANSNDQIYSWVFSFHSNPKVKLIEEKKNTAGPSTEKLIESQSYIIA